MTLPIGMVAAILFICQPNGQCSQHTGGVPKAECGRSVHVFLPAMGGDIKVRAQCTR